MQIRLCTFLNYASVLFLWWVSVTAHATLGNPAVEFDVTLLPGGDILDVKMRRTSGYPAFDSAVERGIYMSKPLPLPPDPALFSKFRNLNVKVHYHE